MISKRIREIGRLIDKNYSVVDIGCDHGYLAQVLRENGNEQLIICADEKKGPLDNARKNLVYYSDILYYLSDGVKNVDKQTDVAVMAGMGHHTVEHIISDRFDYFRNCKKIIIEVNSLVNEMRKWLMNNNFKIVDEIVVHDYKFYEVLVIENGHEELSEKEIKFGPVLLKNKTDVFKEYWISTKNKFEMIEKKLEKGHPDQEIMKQKISEIEEMLNEEL